MLKYAVAIVVFVFGAASALAQPQAPYDNDQIARIKQDADQRRTPDLQNTAPAVESTTDAEHSTDAPSQYCPTCPQPRPHYDKVEVVKSSRDVDQSRVINTQSVVNVPPRTKEINKLIVRENETRNVGVVQHNHTIIEKEIRYVKRRAPVYPAYRVQTTYQPVCQSGALVYWIVRRGGEAMVVPAEALAHGNPCNPNPCNCGTGYVASHGYKTRHSYDTYTNPRRAFMPAHALQAYGSR
jgi:hypothetical protein